MNNKKLIWGIVIVIVIFLGYQYVYKPMMAWKTPALPENNAKPVESVKTDNNPVVSPVTNSNSLDWKTYTEASEGYSISYPSTYHVIPKDGLYNYDQTKFGKENPNGVKIQVQKTSAVNAPSGSKATVTYSEKVTAGPGGVFDVYKVTVGGKEYYQVLVWGIENDKTTVEKILQTFKFTN